MWHPHRFKGIRGITNPPSAPFYLRSHRVYCRGYLYLHVVSYNKRDSPCRLKYSKTIVCGNENRRTWSTLLSMQRNLKYYVHRKYSCTKLMHMMLMDWFLIMSDPNIMCVKKYCRNEINGHVLILTY